MIVFVSSRRFELLLNTAHAAIHYPDGPCRNPTTVDLKMLLKK